MALLGRSNIVHGVGRRRMQRVPTARRLLREIVIQRGAFEALGAVLGAEERVRVVVVDIDALDRIGEVDLHGQRLDSSGCELKLVVWKAQSSTSRRDGCRGCGPARSS